MNYLDPNLINAVGTALNAIGISLQLYSAFKKKNVDIFFGKMLNGDFSKENISKLLKEISDNNDLKLQLYYIINNVSNELIEDKISLWVNACKNLSDDIYTNEIFLKTLNNMSHMEYIILQSYSENPQPMITYPESTTIVAKNKLVAIGLLIYKNHTNPLTWNDLKTGTDIKTEYILSEFGTKMLEFLSDYKEKRQSKNSK